MTDDAPELVAPPRPTRTAWEQEHLEDPPDDAERFAMFPGMPPPLDPVEEYRGRRAAEMERDYWHDQYLALLEERERERDREERHRWTGR